MANGQPTDADPKPSASPSQPLRIVIADDEAVIRLGLKAMLTALGHQVVGMAADGERALAICDGVAVSRSPWWVDYNHAPPGGGYFAKKGTFFLLHRLKEVLGLQENVL